MLGQQQTVAAEVPLTAYQEAQPTAVTEASVGVGLLADNPGTTIQNRQTQQTATKEQIRLCVESPRGKLENSALPLAPLYPKAARGLAAH